MAEDQTQTRTEAEPRTELVPVVREPYELSVEQTEARIAKVREIQRRIMTEGVHYGTIPGTKEKTLFKPGAEILGLAFRLRPRYEILREILEPDHIFYAVRCTLIHYPSGAEIAEGLGSASSWEPRYRYRHAARKCPGCGQETIIKGKEEYGGGWLCWKKKGGCGASFPEGAEEIETQRVGKIVNPDPYTECNTILKIAKKRSFIDGQITATASGDMFKRDDVDGEEPPARGKPEGRKARKRAAPAPAAEPEEPPRESGEGRAAAEAAFRGTREAPPDGAPEMPGPRKEFKLRPRPTRSREGAAPAAEPPDAVRLNRPCRNCGADTFRVRTSRSERNKGRRYLSCRECHNFGGWWDELQEGDCEEVQE